MLDYIFWYLELEFKLIQIKAISRLIKRSSKADTNVLNVPTNCNGFLGPIFCDFLQLDINVLRAVWLFMRVKGCHWRVDASYFNGEVFFIAE